ncbi:MAG: YkgJ family cysteine cluster protein [Desulfonatronovibrionaceae bacterium]
MDLLNFSRHFEKYENLLQQINSVFERMQKEYPQEVTCGLGCTDCCYALFDLHLVEALYLNHKFKTLDKNEQDRILVEADKADRKAFKLKRKLAKESSHGRDDEELLRRFSRERLRCPLLREDDTCALYQFRPITCRVYGLPLDINGETHTCGKSGFEPGQKYPTVKMRTIHENLAIMDKELAKAINSKYTDLHTLLMPVSAALLTEFDAEYLGVKPSEPSPQEGDLADGHKEWVIGGDK